VKRTLEQERAADALRKVRDIEEKLDADGRQRFVSYVESLPATIMANGLGQAAATLLARGEDRRQDPHRLLYDGLQDWLCRDAPEAPFRGASDLMEALVTRERSTYLRAQVEALQWLEWLKKFAVAYLKNAESERGRDS